MNEKGVWCGHFKVMLVILMHKSGLVKKKFAPFLAITVNMLVKIGSVCETFLVKCVEKKSKPTLAVVCNHKKVDVRRLF